MPYIFDFNNSLSEIKTVEVNPKGWINPIIVEYASAQPNKFDTMLSVVWRVQGTTHTFVIHERRLNVLSHADYKAHFTEVLENFREDYLSWFTNEEYKDVEWKYDYKRQFDKYIISE